MHEQLEENHLMTDAGYHTPVCSFNGNPNSTEAFCNGYVFDDSSFYQYTKSGSPVSTYSATSSRNLIIAVAPLQCNQGRADQPIRPFQSCRRLSAFHFLQEWIYHLQTIVVLQRAQVFGIGPRHTLGHELPQESRRPNRTADSGC